MFDTIHWDLVAIIAIIVAYVAFKIFFQKDNDLSEKTGWAFWLGFLFPWFDF